MYTVKVKVKGKVVPVLLNEHHAVKANWGEWRYSSTHSRHQHDYKQRKYILWYYCPRDGNF
jgi:hypothetical protein